MSLKDEPIEGSGDNFWDIDGYKKTVKLVEDGMFMCNEMIKLITERAEIENKYASKLKLWSQKWTESLEKGPEYAIHKGVLLSSFAEAESLAEVHIQIRDQLTDVQNQVKRWRNENYTKQVVGICKEAKLLEEEFKKAQKPWVKKLLKSQKARKLMQVAESNERIIASQLDSHHLNDDQTKKLMDRLEKAKRESENSLDKLESSLKEISSYEPVYAADMECVYEKAEACESKRLDFLKQLLIQIHACIDISVNNAIPHIYMQMRKTIENCDTKKDLMWWALNHGVNMPRQLPTIQASNGTSSQFNSLKKSFIQERSPRLTYTHDSSRITLPDPPISQQKLPPKRVESYDANLNPFGDDINVAYNPANRNGRKEDPVHLPTTSTVHNSIKENKTDNPFDEEDESEYATFGVNNSVSVATTQHIDNKVVKGVTVEAIFDYVSQEDDELSFKIGDRFLKLEDRDDQGWCKGQIGDRIGLYPDNYVKIIH